MLQARLREIPRRAAGESLLRAPAEAPQQLIQIPRAGEDVLAGFILQLQVHAQVGFDAGFVEIRRRDIHARELAQEARERCDHVVGFRLAMGFCEGAGEIRRGHEVATQDLRQRLDQRGRLVLHEARSQPRQPRRMQRVEQVQGHHDRHAIVHCAWLEAIAHGEARIAQRDDRREARGIGFIGDQQVVARPFQRGLLRLRQAPEPGIQRLRVVDVRRQAVEVPLRLPFLVHHQPGAAQLGFLFARLRQHLQVARKKTAAAVDLAAHQRIAHEDHA